MSRLTGFEAVNAASLYEAFYFDFEGISAAARMKRKSSLALVPETLYPGDLEVLQTLVEGTALEVEAVPADPKTGRIDLAHEPVRRRPSINLRLSFFHK